MDNPCLPRLDAAKLMLAHDPQRAVEYNPPVDVSELGEFGLIERLTEVLATESFATPRRGQIESNSGFAKVVIMLLEDPDALFVDLLFQSWRHGVTSSVSELPLGMRVSPCLPFIIRYWSDDVETLTADDA